MTLRDIRVAVPVKVVVACGRTGFTLLELIVVLAILGLGMAIVAPSLVLRSPSPDEALQRVVSNARRVATRRAQTVTLVIDANGAWQVVGAGRDEHEVLLAGELDEPPLDDVHLHITPLGLCVSQARTAGGGDRQTVSGEQEAGTGNGPPTAAGPAVSFDPLTCSLRERLASGR